MSYMTPEYQRQHAAVYRARGKARDYQCVDCDNRAADWSLAHELDPNDVQSYFPRCRKCHLEYDWEAHQHTDETKAKISSGLTGHKRTIASRVNQSMTRTGLDESNILEIRRLFASGMLQSEIADMYDTSRMTINRIVNRKTWTHV